MSIIREIKAAFRWVFNIKDEVKPMPGHIYAHKDNQAIRCTVTNVDENIVTFRCFGLLSKSTLNHSDFSYYWKKIS